MYLSLSEKTIIRCTENYLDQKWYDFVAVQMNNMVVVCGILIIEDEIRIVINPMKVNNTARRHVSNDSVKYQCTTNNIIMDLQEIFLINLHWMMYGTSLPLQLKK